MYRLDPSIFPQQEERRDFNDIDKGAYILIEPPTSPDALLLATGSEVALAGKLTRALNQSGQAIRLVSMPCQDKFSRQSSEFQEQILPSHIHKRIAIEAGSAAFWHKYVGREGLVIGIDQFGASAPASEFSKNMDLNFKIVF